MKAPSLVLHTVTVHGRRITHAPAGYFFSSSLRAAASFFFFGRRPCWALAVAASSLRAVQRATTGYCRQCGSDAFVTDGFNSWNKTERLGLHVGDINSFHNRALKKGGDLMSQDRSIVVAFHKQTEKEKNEHRIRLNASIEACRFLLKNALPFRGHDESEISISKDMFLETLVLIGDCNEDVRAQGYDGASNMCVVVAVANKHDEVENFFNMLGMVINVVNASCKRKDMLRQSYKDRVQEAIGKCEIDIGTRKYQELSLIRTKDTRWGSHYKAILSFIALFPNVVEVLQYVEEDGDNGFSRTQTTGILAYLKTFDFVIYLCDNWILVITRGI
ncbi:uncharacterized protein LOC112516207 [Cynara cardunculus var. scolymus]|uniref:uncharacterized protein LOC112516207 n=1 Tax=Cynara cardunculus var. scolymus TaxID=59895 RepID=UPI000D6249E9|nr:uncharacterized protein LOC112516207 [Cynara cardunculus var. scolymus]